MRARRRYRGSSLLPGRVLTRTLTTQRGTSLVRAMLPSATERSDRARTDARAAGGCGVRDPRGGGRTRAVSTARATAGFCFCRGGVTLRTQREDRTGSAAEREDRAKRAPLF